MPKRILVVEDDLELVELLKFNLANAGFSVATACNGTEGLQKARSLVPDLILLDLMLPGLDGFEVCEILRRDNSTAEVPIIMLTALSTQLARLAGLESGASEYICKPFSLKHLLGRIQIILGQFAESKSRPYRLGVGTSLSPSGDLVYHFIPSLCRISAILG